MNVAVDDSPPVNIEQSASEQKPDAKGEKSPRWDQLYVAEDYFPVFDKRSRAELNALALSTLNAEGESTNDIQLPAWMSGVWAIRDSTHYRKAFVSLHALEFESLDGKRSKKGPLDEGGFPVLGAQTSRQGQLLAIHTGWQLGSDTDSLFVGYIEIGKRASESGQVLEWSFIERQAMYGWALMRSDRERWVFSRINP